MKAEIILIIIVLFFLVVALFIFFRIGSASRALKGENSAAKYFPATVAIILLAAFVGVSYFYKQQQYRQEDELNTVKANSHKIKQSIIAVSDTSLKAANDTVVYSPGRIDSLKSRNDTNLKIVSRVKKSIKIANAFNQENPRLTYSADSSYRILQANRKAIDSLSNIVNQSKNHGYAYYGVFSNGQWDEQNFKVANNAGTFPKVGDKVKSLLPVNVRADVIKYNQSNGWINADLTGAIKKGQTIVVKKIDTVAGNYIWVEF